MAAVNKINDGGKASGSQTIKLCKFNGTTYVLRASYIADSFSLEETSNQQKFSDDDNIPTGVVTTRDLTTGRATLQYASDSTDTPEIGDVFKYTHNGTAAYYCVTAPGKETSKGAESKSNISFYKVLNPTTFKVTAAGGSETSLDLTGITAIDP